MEITLRGKTYKAEHLTDLNYLGIANIFVDDSGNFSLEAVDSFEQLSQADRLRITKPLMKRLTDPKEKSAIACSLAAIFPSLPRELVRFDNEGFALNLSLQELLETAIAVGNALGKPEEVDTEEVERRSAIARLEQELAALKG